MKSSKPYSLNSIVAVSEFVICLGLLTVVVFLMLTSVVAHLIVDNEGSSLWYRSLNVVVSIMMNISYSKSCVGPPILHSIVIETVVALMSSPPLRNPPEFPLRVYHQTASLL